MSKGQASGLVRRVALAALGLLAALWLILFGVGVAGIGRLGEVVSGVGRREDGCAGCAATLSAAGVLRGERAVARIRQMARPLPPERPVTLYLAVGSDPALDSARAGLLVAIADSFAGSSLSPVLALVPRDSARGLPLVGRIITGAGQAAISVYQIGRRPPRS